METRTGQQQRLDQTSASVEQVLERLKDRFRLLTSRSRTGPQRHQTLRAALDWGHDLLDEHERRLFRRLSVFPGSFELAAAEAVCALETPAEDIVGLLARLVEKSLIVLETGSAGPPRYRMLETIRQYAAERLQAGEYRELSRRSVDYFSDLADQDQAVRVARAGLPNSVEAPRPADRPSAPRHGLSRRHMEIAKLLAEGLTNREIARRLFISERTVEGHVMHICHKLGLRSRTQVAVWMAKLGGLWEMA